MSPSHWAMIQVLCDLESGLTDWEVNFIEDLSRRGSGYQLTPKQTDVLEKIYEERTA